MNFIKLSTSQEKALLDYFKELLQNKKIDDVWFEDNAGEPELHIQGDNGANMFTVRISMKDIYSGIATLQSYNEFPGKYPDIDHQ